MIRGVEPFGETSERGVEAGSKRGSASRRDRCPTCGARRGPETICPRCQSDLGLLLILEARADRMFQSARRAYRDGYFRLAAARAATACRLEASPEILRLWAVAALRAGDFQTARRAGRRLLRSNRIG